MYIPVYLQLTEMGGNFKPEQVAVMLQNMHIIRKQETEYFGKNIQFSRLGINLTDGLNPPHR